MKIIYKSQVFNMVRGFYYTKDYELIEEFENWSPKNIEFLVKGQTYTIIDFLKHKGAKII